MESALIQIPNTGLYGCYALKQGLEKGGKGVMSGWEGYRLSCGGMLLGVVGCSGVWAMGFVGLGF